MSYDFTYMWNLKNNIIETDREEGVGRLGEKGERIPMYKLVVTK